MTSSRFITGLFVFIIIDLMVIPITNATAEEDINKTISDLNTNVKSLNTEINSLKVYLIAAATALGILIISLSIFSYRGTKSVKKEIDKLKISFKDFKRELPKGEDKEDGNNRSESQTI